MNKASSPGFRILLISILVLLNITSHATAQDSRTKTDYNTIYRFPASVSVEYQFVSPMAIMGTDYQGDFSTVDFSVLGRFPIKSVPVLQPQARLGFYMNRAQYNAADPDLDNFDFTRFYGTGGLAYMTKLNKQFELGADIEAGFGYSIFPNIDQTTGDSHGAWDFQTSLGLTAAFNPSYNMTIQLHPSLRYNTSMSPLERFDGFILGIGIKVGYRFGTDPDDPKAEIRSIQFGNPQVEDMFAAMQSYYIDNPFGEVTLTNTEKYALTDLKVTFYQPGYMNIATSVAEIAELLPGASQTVPITASFDKNIFSLEGVTPLTGELKVDYNLRTRRAAQTIPVNYDLYDKNSLTWDDDRKVAAFITSGDSALSNYISYLRQTCKDVVNPGYSEAVQTGMQVFYGLTEIGCLYQRDPTLSYEDAKGDTLVVDSVNLPRETLTKLAGDCDDLTVLFNAMLESSGIETGFVTVPGHIYSIFSTGVAARDYRLIHPDKNMTVAIDGILWVPVEITFIGEDDFQSAWRAGAEEFVRFVDAEDALGLYFTREAQQVYRPVGFEERDLGLQYGDRSKIVRDFDQAIDSATRLVIDEYEIIARNDNSKGSWNKLGIVSAMFEDYSVAEKAFQSSLSLDRNYSPAKINLANVYFKREEYQNALRLYHEVEQRLREAGRTESASYARLLLNISKTYHEVENFDQAARYSERLYEVNPQLADRYAYLADSAGARAADISAASGILFIEE